jgi:hypothetical protein
MAGPLIFGIYCLKGRGGGGDDGMFNKFLTARLAPTR